jgi:protein-disulfide isomerase
MKNWCALLTAIFHCRNAPLAAQAAACANDNGRFEAYKAILFRGQAQWSNSSSETATQQFAEFATFSGLNKSQFLECLKSDSAKNAIASDMDIGRKVGLSSTPSFVVNGYLVAGALPVEAFKAILEKVGNQ